MTRQESPDEVEAKEIVNFFSPFNLRFADEDGDVDYRFTTVEGSTGALEVTTVTSAANKVAAERWKRESPKFGPAETLRTCWQVWIEDDGINYRRLTNRLEPELFILESAGIRYARYRHHELINATDEVRAAVTSLAMEKVELAVPCPELCSAEKHDRPHRIEIVRQTGHVASGSDASLTLIEAEMSLKPDNFGKLRGVDCKHLFIWVDRDTDLSIARPFRGGNPTDWDHFKLPSRPPALLEPIHKLWIVDRATRFGWVWDPEGSWQDLDARTV